MVLGWGTKEPFLGTLGLEGRIAGGGSYWPKSLGKEVNWLWLITKFFLTKNLGIPPP